MKVIKKFWVPIFIVCFLLLGYVIGQWRNSIKAEKELKTEVSNVSEVASQNDTSITPSGDDQNSSDVVSGEEWEGLHLSFENSSETADNPWGITAGLIDVDDVGKCILLTPNTCFTIKDLSSESVISLEAEIHPWVADSSDGAGIDVWIMDENDEILKKDEISIDSQETWSSIQYSVGDIANAKQIKFLCNNGNAEDDSCDWVIIRMAHNYLSDFGKDDYVRSATYFGEAWPINFWNSELKTLDKDFEQIEKDGFNSIILCIPWREFQIKTIPIEYNNYPFDNLDKIMTCAKKHNLDVYTRIGYHWDYCNDEDEYITERYLNILQSSQVHDAWLDYCKTMYEKLSSYSNFKDGFLTWEDFWGCLAICDSDDEQKRIEYAKSIGYQKWVEVNYGIEAYNDKFGCDYVAIDIIPVPRRTDPGMEAFFEFYDNYLNNLLSETQEVFPNMSIEVRMDADLITNKDGVDVLYMHNATYSCEKSDYTATMYGIPMGFENKGERVSSEDALYHTEYILGNLLNNNDGKPIYIEQFLFMDNTPQFSYNAQIKDNEVGTYLEDVSDVLLKYTKGYGIWTYKDYKNNMLFNPEFALGNQGWKVIGSPSVEIDEKSDTWTCNLGKGDGIAQTIPMIRNHFPSDVYTLEFEVIENNDATMEVSMGSEKKKFSVTELGSVDIEIPANDSFDFELRVVNGAVEIDNLCLYSFVQEGHLYDAHNEEQEHIDSIRVLNEELKASGE